MRRRFGLVRWIYALAIAAAGCAHVPKVPLPTAGDPETRAQRVEDAILERLHDAGDHRRCRAEMAVIRDQLADDRSLTVDDLVAMRQGHDTAGSGPMPYPSPGTACALFGIQVLLEGAVNDKLRARGEPPKYREDDRPLTVGGE